MPERLGDDDIWWSFLPGEQFTDSYGVVVVNKSENAIPIRVFKKGDTGLMIQVNGGNHFIDGASDFTAVVTKLEN